MDPIEKILVVDDDSFVRGSLRAFLEDIGFAVIEAGQAGQAGAVLERCLQDKPDLVLLDINMPDQNGFEVCRSLKAVPELRETPVIFLSGRMETEDKLEAFASGGVDYVSKPFRLEEVEARVRTHLELRRQRRQLEASRKSLEDALDAARLANRQLIEVNERLRESEELKSHFIAHMRNELNDPLTSILGLAVGISNPHVSCERRQELGGLLQAEAAHLDFELQNIFCAAELEAGEASPSFATVDVASVLRSAAEAFTHSLRAKSQTLDLRAEAGSSPFITDAAKVRLILANLLANAIEFSPAGGRIELRALMQDDALLLEVEDQGTGLSGKDIAAIFERFRQLDAGHMRAHGGQGLGLAVVKALAELLDGRILVDSEPGRGSKFTCSLPARPLSDNPDSASFDGNLFIFDEMREL